MCPECRGQGKKSKGLSKKAQLLYRKALLECKTADGTGTPSVLPKAHLYPCQNCRGTGLIPAAAPPVPDMQTYPHIAIIGGGIGGVALAVACLHRGIPFTLYERDPDFHARSQGYGLTLQQAGKAIEALGISQLEDAVVSTRHLVHDPRGKIIGEWGARKWLDSNAELPEKRTNMHIARQSLRLALLKQLGGHDAVQWGHQLLDFTEADGGGINLRFLVDGEIKNVHAGLLVGADGIRSTVRKQLIGESTTPLCYLDCIVILGICPLAALDGIDTPLLDSATVFQTANGKERIYMMPYTANEVMWQLSFPMAQAAATALSAGGSGPLKEEACRRTQWHTPIPQIVAATPETRISGYPVYDRQLLSANLLEKAGSITLIGDAAHPMSPFKGQGANQALLDALALARSISKGCKSAGWIKTGIRKSVLAAFESEMLKRSAVKVKDSATAAGLLHSEIVLKEGNAPRGRCLKENK